MGRLEALTALALGRGHYEDEVILNAEAGSSQQRQQYNERGHPRNPETKRREREHVRAANEVMQVTGVVEDSLVAKMKARANNRMKTQETYVGLRLLEFGRAALVSGVWGVLGLRRRILLYKSYTDVGIYDIVRKEAKTYSISHIIFAGFPAVFAYHIMDRTEFWIRCWLEQEFNEEDHDLSPADKRLKAALIKTNESAFYYINIHLRLFAILQQLNLIPSSRLLPSLLSFVPFTAASHLIIPPNPALNLSSIASWGLALLRTVSPFLVIVAHGKVKLFASKLMYRPVYKLLPRPTGDSVFSGLPVEAPTIEYDAPDNEHPLPEEPSTFRSEDEQTLRALEGLPRVERARSGSQPQQELNQDSSDDEEDEVAHATLISFDVEATESVENSLGTWSAELRSANEPKASGDVKYRVTGLTMLPVFTMTEGLREVIAGIIVMPIEAIMVRVIARVYRVSIGLETADMYPAGPGVRGLSNILAVLTMQVAAAGIAWAGFTLGTQLWASKHRRELVEKATAEHLEIAATGEQWTRN